VKKAPLAADKCPLEWWKGKSKFPAVATLARRTLCIPATSASSERLFSSAGKIVTRERARLVDEVVSTLVYLRQSYPIVERHHKKLKTAGGISST
jgi:hypothetical protein